MKKNKNTFDKKGGALGMKALSRVLLIPAMFLASSLGLASDITDVEFNSLPGGKVEMKFMLDGAVPNPNVYTIESPARIAIDLEGVGSQLAQKKHSLDLGNTQSVMVLESGGRTRVIVNLLELSKYSTRVEGNQLVVEVGNSGVRDYIKPGEGSEVEKVASSAAESAISSIDFRRGEDGEGRLIVELSNPKIDVDSQVVGKDIKLSFLNTEIPEKLKLRYDVSDFATPVSWVKASEEKGAATINIRPTGEYDFLSYQADNKYVLTVKPLSEQEVIAKRKEFAYVGDRLSLNFQDIDVRAVLQLIADFTELNLVASDTVSGKITLRLQNVPWDQALDIILKTKGLDKRQDGNVLLVAPAAEIAAREKQALEASKQIEELAPLQTEFIKVRYAKASDIFGLLQGGSGSGGDSGAESSATILSPRASVIVDERTNSLLVTETASKLEEIRKLVNLIDVPIRQVSVEARIVNATTDASDKLGIAWGGQSVRDGGSDRYVLSGSQSTFLSNVGSSPAVSAAPSRVVDLGINDAGATRLNVGFFSSSLGQILDLELSAIESSGKGEVVSQPKIITGDKQTATIKSGQQIAIQESSANGGTTTAFQEAALSLEVTPSITPDDRIIMDIKINQDSLAGFAPGTDAAIIDTTELETQVLVANGESVVLGGVFQTQDVESETKTPFLGDIPFIGRLFKRTSVTSEKTEILIFITPRILSDTLVE